MGTRQHPRRGTGAASGLAPDRSRSLKITSVSSGVGGGMELDTPPVSPSMAGVGAAGTSSTAADGVLDDVVIVEAAVSDGGPPAPLSAGACS
jgi:hypothetical protein